MCAATCWHFSPRGGLARCPKLHEPKTETARGLTTRSPLHASRNPSAPQREAGWR
jgi:hypothetical protein